MKDVYVIDLIQDFLEHIEIEKGRSLNTVRNYELYLNRFYEIAERVMARRHKELSDADRRLYAYLFENRN